MLLPCRKQSGGVSPEATMRQLQSLADVGRVYITIYGYGHTEICESPAVTCENRLRASCEQKKDICGHLRAVHFICVQFEVSSTSICGHLRASASFVRSIINFH